MSVGHADIVDISTTVDLHHLVSCLPPPFLNPATRLGDDVGQDHMVMVYFIVINHYNKI
jgi:hypothetical protein